jgi:hypothetical protein
MRCPLIVIIAHLVFRIASVATKDCRKGTPASTIGLRRGPHLSTAHTPINDAGDCRTAHVFDGSGGLHSIL